MRKIVPGIFFISALLLCACGRFTPGGEKIAVLDWQRAVAQHPQHRRLVQGEAVYRDLQRKRTQQAAMAATQITSLDKLQELKQWSEKSYLEADFNTRMAEEQAWANGRLKDAYEEAAAEAEQEIADRKKAVEETYQLRIFNLRMQLESLKMPPTARRDAEKELEAVRQERGLKLDELEREKQGRVAELMQPQLNAVREHLRQRSEELRQNISSQLHASADKYEQMLDSAPDALQNALRIMAREINRQREENERRSQVITADLEKAVAQLARERGYNVVFREYQVNITADDITQDVIAEIKKVQSK